MEGCGVVVTWNAVVVQAVAATAARRRRPIAVLCLWVYRGGRKPGCSDRYAIRTRNLQDWNLTRYRCANRSSKVKRSRGRRRGTSRVGQCRRALARGAALRWLLLPRRKEVVCNVNRPTLRSVTAYKCSVQQLHSGRIASVLKPLAKFSTTKTYTVASSEGGTTGARPFPSLESKLSVTGPSLTKATSIIAPNRPSASLELSGSSPRKSPRNAS